MSSLTMFGFLALGAGRRVMSIKPGSSSKTWHCFYASVVQLSSGQSLPAEIRAYSPFNDVVHPDNTVAFIVAKAHFPAHDTLLLDAYHIIPVPGNPSDDSYDNHLPDCPHPFVLGIGSVPVKTDVLADGVSKAFEVITSEYVRDSVKSTSVQCVFDGTSPRWSNTPVPNVNSIVQFFGTCAALTPSGVIRVNVENIVLNIGPSASSNSTSLSSPSPTKRRKFNAFVSPQPSYVLPFLLWPFFTFFS
ncbi:hypothetical protein BJ138DRAFT_1014023 [Hygrophoropsis aurantiaca]|uniref:Uncharacterized protein n=1 Tax=Hygrophoropsis aurantiaca TaxID=72124 RepID=A0ACB8A373_9AGAM|nr:hypothetical protein BJ138DRAFT_1014023 [Hygrophoropsis aurantiaca]